MTAPSIKDALEHYAHEYCEGWCEQDAGCANFDDCGGCLARRALATFQPDGERREAIAPLRNRLADLIHQNYEPPPEGFPETEPWNGGALEIVDMIIEEILASGLVQDEAGIRASQREIDAKIADKEAAYLLVTGARLRSYTQAATKLAYTEVDLHEQAGTAIKSVVAAIRSARDGGAES